MRRGDGGTPFYGQTGGWDSSAPAAACAEFVAPPEAPPGVDCTATDGGEAIRRVVDFIEARRGSPGDWALSHSGYIVTASSPRLGLAVSADLAARLSDPLGGEYAVRVARLSTHTRIAQASGPGWTQIVSRVLGRLAELDAG